VQNVTGSTKAEANRQVRVGEALIDDGADAQPGLPNAGSPDAAAEPAHPSMPWHQPLRDALRENRLTSAQFDAIRRGLGEPPEIGADAGSADAGGEDGGSASGTGEALVEDLAAAEERTRLREEARREARDAWARAAEQLAGEATDRTAEELWQHAHTIRDMLDPEGAEARFLARFENRSFRTYRGQDGQKRASMVLDDDGDLFLESMLAAALRPRRGGPRFVDAEEKQRAAALTDDPRTNEQLAYDLVMDVLRSGALADVANVFGARQAGVRLVRVIDANGTPSSIAHSEDHLIAVPGAAADQRLCETGAQIITLDGRGNPLDVGRESRLFTPKQRIALAIRDGGCRWRGCDRPASYCEAHHIDEWDRDQGRTDIDRGILLCRYHHMTLHHGGWRISRAGTDDFVLHHPSGEDYAMRPRAPLGYAWTGIDPPPQRFRPAA